MNSVGRTSCLFKIRDLTTITTLTTSDLLQAVYSANVAFLVMCPRNQPTVAYVSCGKTLTQLREVPSGAYLGRYRVPRCGILLPPSSKYLATDTGHVWWYLGGSAENGLVKDVIRGHPTSP